MNTLCAHIWKKYDKKDCIEKILWGRNQHVKELPAKSKELSSVPRIHTVERENQSLQAVLWSSDMLMTYTHAHTQIKSYLKH